MTNINFYLNETLINPPKNWKEFGIELNFDKDKSNVQQQVSITDFEFVRENSDIIHKWITDGLTTGVGVFEGIPFRVEVARGRAVEVPFDGYLDLTQNSIFRRNDTTARAVESDGIDWLNDVADSFTFEHLYKDKGTITWNDFDFIPYVINTVPNYIEAATATLGVYVMVKEIKDAIQKIAELAADAPVYYVFSTYIKIILYIIYLILLIIALIKLVKTIVLLIIQPVKYHACMSVLLQLKKGAEHLGMTFKSTFLESEPFNATYIVPQKYYNEVNGKEKKIFGFTDPHITQEGFYKGTFGDLIRECKKMFNAKLLIKGNEVWLVRDDFNTSINQYTLKQPYNEREFTLNTDEFKANYLISFLTDSVDKNTLQDYAGTSYQVIIEPQRISRSGMTLMKGLEESRINLALSTRKDDLTIPESILDAFLKVFTDIAGAMVSVVNAIIDVLNTVIAIVNDILDKLGSIGIKINFRLPDIPKVDFPDFKNIFKNRVGMMMIESDIINVPKIFLMDKGSSAKYNKIRTDNHYYLTASYLYNNFHYINTFIPYGDTPCANQYYKYSFDNVPFSFSDYLMVKNNNCIFLESGENALIDSLKWNVHEQIANMKIRVNKIYTTNLKSTAYEPNGK